MSWMVAPIEFGGYAPDGIDGLINGKSKSLGDVYFNPYGGIEAVNDINYFNEYPVGLSTISGQMETIKLNSMFQFLSGANSYLLVQGVGLSAGVYSGDNIYLVEDGGTAPTRITGMGNTNGYDIYFSVLNGYLFITSSDGATKPVYWKGSGSFTSLSASGLYPRYCETHYNRIFTASSEDFQSRLWWSDITDPTVFTPLVNFADIDKDSGDVITGLKSYLGDIYVFKKQGVYKIIGNDFDASSGNYSILKLEGLPGCVSQKSICVADGIMYYFSQNGLVSYNGSTVKPIGYGNIDKDAIRGLVTRTSSTDELVKTSYNIFTKELFIIYNSGDDLNFVTYNIVNGKFSRYENASSTSVEYRTATEMTVLPSADGWTWEKGTGSYAEGDKNSVAGGILFMSSSGLGVGQNNFYRLIDNTLNNENGITLDLRLKTVNSDETQATYFAVSDGVKYHYLYIYPGKVVLASTPSNVEYTYNTSSDYATYRLKTRGLYSDLYINGTLVISQALTGILDGSAGGQVQFGGTFAPGFGGIIYIDYLRYSNRDAGTIGRYTSLCKYLDNDAAVGLTSSRTSIYTLVAANSFISSRWYIGRFENERSETPQKLDVDLEQEYSTDWLKLDNPNYKSSPSVLLDLDGSGTMDIDVYYDYDEVSSETKTVDITNDRIQKIHFANRKFRNIKLKFTNNSSSYFNINSAFLEYNLDTESGRV